MGSRDLHEWPASIYEVDENNRIIEELGHCATYSMAYAAYKAIVAKKAYSCIQLRERGRIAWTAKTGAYDSATEKVALEWER